MRFERFLKIAAQIESEPVDPGVDPGGDLLEPDRQMCTIIAMSETVHLVEGYSPCVRCETWVRDEVARRTDGMCPEHFAEAGGKRITHLELVGRGMIVKAPVAKRERRRKPRGTPERAERKRLAGRAKRAARKRVAAIFPDIYDICLAEERAALGLEPWPAEIAVRGGDGEVELGFAEMARQLTERKIAV